MNSVSSRLKAVAITALFFALSGFVLLGCIWALAALPVPGLAALDAYRPHDTIAVLSDLRLAVALSAAFLTANGIVIALASEYLDRMIAIFADVLLMLMAAAAGFVAGYWVLLRLAGFANFMGWDFARTAIVPPVIVFAVSLISPRWARSSWPLRLAMVTVFLVAAPFVLITLP